MIELPLEIKQGEHDTTLMRFSPNGPWRKTFVRGAITFPRYEETSSRFCGSVSVCAIHRNGRASLYHIENFEIYDFSLANLFSSLYETYRVSHFYYRADGSGDEDARKFEIQSGIRRRKNLDSVYPLLVPLRFPTDYHVLESFLVRSENETFEADGNSILQDAISYWDQSRGFDLAPSELRCTAVNLAGLDRDSIYWRTRE